MNPLLGAMGEVGYAMDTPGAYLRGVLSGRPGERASGRDMLESWGAVNPDQAGLDAGDVAGFGVDLLADPLNWLGGAGIHAGTGALRGLSRADDVNPVLKAVSGFVGDEAGHIDLDAATRLMQTADNPLGRMKALSRHSPADVSVAPAYQEASYNIIPGFDPALENYAQFEKDPRELFTSGRKSPQGFTVSDRPTVIPNLYFDEWGNDELMRKLVSEHVGSGLWPGPSHVDQIPVHELGHAFHEQQKRGAKAASGIDYESLPIAATDVMRYISGGPMWGGVGRGVKKDIRRHLGSNAISHPNEFVAESFTNQVLGQGQLPAPLRGLYRDLLGPDIDSLPSGFWDTLHSFSRPGGLR